MIPERHILHTMCIEIATNFLARAQPDTCVFIQLVGSPL